MKIDIMFSSLKDLSDLSYGERLLEILSSHGFVVDKASCHEPIRKDFCLSNLPDLWKCNGSDEKISTNSLLFRGKKEIKFMGMVTWDRNLHPNTKSFNGISLWLNIPNNYDISRLVQLADDLFAWCEAVYGYITEESKGPYSYYGGNVYDGIISLSWVNYFGTPYVIEPDFHIPSDQVPTGHGVRLMLSETPNDEKLSDSDFLESYKNKIGVEWFWSRSRRKDKKIPFFDRSEISRKEPI